MARSIRAMAIAMVLFGCSGKLDDEKTGARSEGAAGADTGGTASRSSSAKPSANAAGGVRTNGSAGSGNTAPSSSEPASVGSVVELTSDQLVQIFSNSCAASGASVDVLPSYIEFVVDASDSMNAVVAGKTETQWQLTKRSLTEAFAALSASDVYHSIHIGLRLLPAPVNSGLAGATCVKEAAEVPLLSSANNAGIDVQALSSILDARIPQGKTPLLDAYLAAVADHATVASLFGSTVVLVTDGNASLNRGCTEPCTSAVSQGGAGSVVSGCPVRKLASATDALIADNQPLIDAIDAAYKEYGIRTIVVGTVGSEANRKWLSTAATYGQVARAGCTSPTDLGHCQVDLSVGDNLSDALLPLFGSSSDWCTIGDIPPGPDPSKLVLVYRFASTFQRFTYDNQGPSPCDEGFRVVGSTIELCAGSCKRLSAEPVMSVDLVMPCSGEPLPLP